MQSVKIVIINHSTKSHEIKVIDTTKVIFKRKSMEILTLKKFFVDRIREHEEKTENLMFAWWKECVFFFH
jgi:hypothetical protein